MKEKINDKNIKVYIKILVFPIVAAIFNVLALSILNLGTMLGTFIRNLYELIV